MNRLIITAAASPIFGNFLMVVSVSKESDGTPVKALKPSNFTVYHLASLNHAFPTPRIVTKAAEGPDGFYILDLKPLEIQPQLPPGDYVFGVAVAAGKGKSGPTDHGQTVAVGNLPTYGQWQNA